MAIEDLAEGLTTSEVTVSVWRDDETKDVFIQYGYVSIAMPMEDFLDFITILNEAEEALEAQKGDRRSEQGDGHE